MADVSPCGRRSTRARPSFAASRCVGPMRRIAALKSNIGAALSPRDDPESMASLTRHLKDTESTAALGAELALMARAGSIICLHGELGSGKTTLARSFIQALAGK